MAGSGFKEYGSVPLEKRSQTCTFCWSSCAFILLTCDPPPPSLPRGAVAADPEEQRPHALRRIRGTAQPCPAQAVESQQSRQEAQQI